MCNNRGKVTETRKKTAKKACKRSSKSYRQMAAKREKLRAAQKAAFVAAYRVFPNVIKACEAAKIGRRTYYDWRQEDEDFAKAADEARQDGIDGLEAEATGAGGTPGEPRPRAEASAG